MNRKYAVVAGLLAVSASVISSIAYSTTAFAKQTQAKSDAFTCWMNYEDYGSNAKTDKCFSDTDAAQSSKKYGDFPIIAKGVSLDAIAKSDINLEKFLADEKFVQEVIAAQNYNINLYLDLAKGINTNGWDVEYLENDPYILGIKEFVATLEHGRITNTDELLTAIEVLQVGMPLMDFTLGELQENFDIIIDDSALRQ